MQPGVAEHRIAKSPGLKGFGALLFFASQFWIGGLSSIRIMLGVLPHDPQGRGFEDKDYLENMLLVRGWRRYTWQDLMSSPANATVQLIQSPPITGRVSYHNKQLKEAVMVSVIRDSLIDLVTTEADGSFILAPDQLLTSEGPKVALLVNKKNKEGYTVEVEDPFAQVNQKLAEKVEIATIGPTQYVQSSKDQELEGMENRIMLNEVVINGNPGDNSIYGTMKVKGPNACGDYVDEWGYLNYEYSAKTGTIFQPVVGKQYEIRTDIKGYGPGTGHTFSVRGVIYEGCLTEKNNTTFKIKGIYTAKKFYGVDTDHTGINVPQFRSTLFWKPGVISNAEGEAEFDFITGDITGKFRVIIQGVGYEDMIFGTGGFIVK